MGTTTLYQQLLLTFAGVSALTACGSAQAPVNATEVPGAPTDAPAADMPTAPADAASAQMASAPVTSATPTAAMPSAIASAGGPSAPATPMPKAKDMPKGNHTTKVADSKRKKACQAGCGEGTCGTACN